MIRQLGFFACALLAACAHYQPQPLAVADIADRGRPAALDVQAVQAELARPELAKLFADRSWDGQRWDEASLLAAAFVYNPDLRAARAAAEAARAEAQAARVRPGPALTLTAEYAFNPAESSPWLIGLASDQWLDFGGRRRARIADADILAGAAAYELENAAWTVRTNIATALGAVRASAVVTAHFAQIAPLRTRQLAALNLQLAQGAATRLDLERVRQAAANDATAAAAARAEAQAARLALATAIGVAPLAVDGLVFAPARPQALEPPTLELRPEQRASALQARPDIFAAVVAYDRSEQALRAAVAAQYPAISIGPGYTWERGLSKLPFNLTLALPAADFGAAGIAAAEARREAAARQLEAVVATAERSVDAAFLRYRAAQTIHEITRDQTLPSADAIAAQADRALDAGAMDRATWADARIGALSAAVDLARAEQALTAARVALEGALRQSFDPPALGHSAAHQTPGNLASE